MAPFKDIPYENPGGIFAIFQKYVDDPSPLKCNLAPGAYRTDDGKPYRVPAITKAFNRLNDNPETNFEYNRIEGVPEFLPKAAELVFGKDSKAIKEGRVASLQTIGGSGANRIAGYFLQKYYDYSECADSKPTIYISDPTWFNHWDIFRSLGMETKPYPYYDPELIWINIDDTLEFLGNIPDRSVVLLHACAHNPTGVDPTHEEWQKFADLFKRKNLFAFFDFAYQGFASGDMDTDAYSIRLFEKMGIPMLVAQSFSKNAGLYGERLGVLHVIAPETGSGPQGVESLQLALMNIQCPEFFAPPAFFAKVIAETLGDDQLLQEFKINVHDMAQRVIDIRHKLYDELIRRKTPSPNNRGWEHIIHQIGFFSYTGLTPEQCEDLINNRHVYLLESGRVSMPGLYSSNVEYVAEQIDAAIRQNPFPEDQLTSKK